MKSKLCYDLLEMIEKQTKIIEKQNEIIIKLTKDSLEKENIINELMKEGI